MLIVKVKNKKDIERALKEMKNKVKKTKLHSELRERQQYTKKSIKRREVIKKAKYLQSLKTKNEE